MFVNIRNLETQHHCSLSTAKPGRPTKRIQNQLEAIDTELRKLNDTTIKSDTTSEVEENDRKGSTVNKDQL